MPDPAPRPRRKHARVMWLSGVTSLLLIAALVGSGWTYVVLCPLQCNWTFAVSCGRVGIWTPETPWTQSLRDDTIRTWVEMTRARSLRFGPVTILTPDVRVVAPSWGWGFAPRSHLDRWILLIPLWLPALLLALLSGTFWYRGRVCPANPCPSCRYDRAGLDPAAVCPECGKAPPSSLTIKANSMRSIIPLLLLLALTAASPGCIAVGRGGAYFKQPTSFEAGQQTPLKVNIVIPYGKITHATGWWRMSGQSEYTQVPMTLHPEKHSAAVAEWTLPAFHERGSVVEYCMSWGWSGKGRELATQTAPYRTVVK